MPNVQSEEIPDQSSTMAEIQNSEAQPSMQDMTFEQLSELAIEYEVKSGETLSEIASHYNVGTGLLVRLNAISNVDLIRSGKKIKVLQGPFRILIKKGEKTLSLSLGDRHYKTYDIAVGKSDSTPEGEFKIMTKIVKPTWTDPYSRLQIKGDDPRYPLGTRWMQFAEYGYGIHGTNNPSSIKTEASFGCIRMLDADVEEVYDLVTLGTTVQILP